MKRILCLFIIIFVFTAVLASVVNVNALVANITPAPSPTPLRVQKPCEQIPSQKGKNKIAIQITNIQAYDNTEKIISLINIANNKQIPVVESVIPENIAEDKKLVDFLKSVSCKNEIAQQGTHVMDIPELKGLSKERIKDVVSDGRNILENIFDAKIKTFVPQRNWYNFQILSTLDTLGYKTISVEGWLRDSVGFPTYSFSFEEKLTNSQLVYDCKLAFSYKRTCVIIVYPSSYTDNLLDFSDLLNSLKEIKDTAFITFNN